MTDRLLPGVRSERVATRRITTHLLHPGRDAGEPVVFIHGLISSSLFWQRTMLDLPERYRPLAVDLRGFGDSDPAEVDARRGLSDYADDVHALLDALDVPAAHLVGWSMGGATAARMLLDQPGRVTSLTLVNPVSPFGFGGTHGAEGQLNDPSGAGSGGGCANPDFTARLRDGDRSGEAPTSPRQVLLGMYVSQGVAEPGDIDTYLDGMLSTRIGDGHYPGEVRSADAWPGLAPGKSGVINALSPLYPGWDGLPNLIPKPPVTWIRGTDDAVISDASLFDLAHLGSIGSLEGWPGANAAPPQPMVTQTRHVLDAYAAAGGSYTEKVFADTGHTPHIERPAEFRAALLAGLGTTDSPV